MRGKAVSRNSLTVAIRITPAHAGKSAFTLDWEGNGWDHPRTCGEKYSQSPQDDCMVGSPPHMRGKVGTNTPATYRDRITPAHAGKRLKESLKTAIKLMKKISFHSVCYKLHIKADNPQQLYDSVHPLFQSMKQLYQAYNYPTL